MARDDAHLAGAIQPRSENERLVPPRHEAPRTSRASAVQPISEMIRVIMKYTSTGDHVTGMAAASPIHSGIVGTDMMNSITLWITVSIAPPK